MIRNFTVAGTSIKTIDTIYIGGNDNVGYFFELSRGPILVAVDAVGRRTREESHQHAIEFCRENCLTIAEGALTAHQFASELRCILTSEEDDLSRRIATVRSFREAGVFTDAEGFVVRMGDGTEYQVTVVRST